MRTFLFAALIGSLTAPAAFAEDAIEQAPGFGTYGYRHTELHQYGIIDRLIELNGHNCCDGGMGGECRVTEIRHESSQAYFLHDGVWCPIHMNVPIYLLNMPSRASAVVCASKGMYINSFGKVCPTAVYCAGQGGSM